jgi:hypothetical protein
MAATEPQGQTVTAPAPAADVKAKAPAAAEITNAPALSGDMTPEQRKDVLAEVRRRMKSSALTVVAPPGWKYRWARHTDSQDIARLEFKGYRVVHENPKSPRYKTAVRLRDDGTYIVGDVILMEVPEEVWQFLREDEKERADKMVEGATEDFVNQTLSQEVPVFERDENGRVLNSRGVKRGQRRR